MAVAPAVQSALQQATVADGATSAQTAAQAHALWLQGEINSYGPMTSAAQAHALWLQGEINSYGPTPAQAWFAYRQFRLSEEGYAE